MNLLRPAGDSVYEIRQYGAMIADRARTDAYLEALRRSVLPNSVVVDIGTGSGTFALMAAQLGARRVFAIDPDKVIQLARELADANGLSDRIEFIEAPSTDIDLPERADVIVSDLHGALPLYDGHIPSIADARRRHLREDGRLIPAREALQAAVASAARLYDETLGIWSSRPYELDLEIGRHMVANRRWTTWIEPDQLLTEPQEWGVLEYTTIDDPSIDASLSWTLEDPGTAHGLCLWYESTLFEDIGFSNAPGQPKGVYPHSFLPFERPLELAAGDVVSVRLRATHTGDDDYLWRWRTELTGMRGATETLDQSSFDSRLLSLSQLERSAVGHVPKLRPEGEAVRTALGLMDGTRTILQVAEELVARFPSEFRDDAEAARAVAELSQQLGR